MKTYPIQMERVFYRSPSEDIVLKATILQTYDEVECEEAFDELLRVHPRLSCTVEEDEKHQLYYKANPDRSIPISYYVDTIENNWENVLREELKRPFFLEQDLSIRACIIDKKREFDLIIIMHHMLGDGLSLFYVYQDFLQIYFNNSKLLPKDSRPMQKRDLPKDSKPNLATRAGLHYINQLWKKETHVYQNSDFPKVVQTYQQVFDCNFSIDFVEPSVMLQLYEKSHEYNVTINSILVTALLYQLLQSPITTTEEQKVTIATNMRKRLLMNPGNSVGNYAGCITPILTYDEFKDFWSNVKLIHNQVQELLTSDKEFFSISQVFGSVDTSIFDGLTFDSYTDLHSKNAKKVVKYLSTSKKEGGFSISNLGRFNQEVNSRLILVKDFVYLPPYCPSFDLTVGVVTMSNQMNLSILYNENRFDHQAIESILHCTLALLTKVSKFSSKGEYNEKESKSENVI